MSEKSREWQGWRPFVPSEWHDRGSCYPCLIHDTADNTLHVPCDPWTLDWDIPPTWRAMASIEVLQRLAAPSPAPAADKLGSWLSAALDDPNVCAEMKADIEAWFKAGQPSSHE
jgi:hypothetical protein